MDYLQYIILIVVAAVSFVIGRKTVKTFAPKQAGELREMRAEAREALSERTEKRKERILYLMNGEAVHQSELKACGVSDLKKGVTSFNVKKLLGVARATARKYLNELEDESKIRQIGERGRNVYYVLNR